MNSNDITVSMVTNALQRGEKENMTKNQEKNEMKWYKQSITFLLCIYETLSNFKCFTITQTARLLSARRISEVIKSTSCSKPGFPSQGSYIMAVLQLLRELSAGKFSLIYLQRLLSTCLALQVKSWLQHSTAFSNFLWFRRQIIKMGEEWGL